MNKQDLENTLALLSGQIKHLEKQANELQERHEMMVGTLAQLAEHQNKTNYNGDFSKMTETMVEFMQMQRKVNTEHANLLNSIIASIEPRGAIQ